LSGVPVDFELLIPRNDWRASSELEDFQLTSPSLDSPVAVLSEPAEGSNDWLWIRPAERLENSTEYELRPLLDPDDSTNQNLRWTFVTSASDDAPELPEVEVNIVGTGFFGACESHLAAASNVQLPEDIAAQHIVQRLDITGNGTNTPIGESSAIR